MLFTVFTSEDRAARKTLKVDHLIVTDSVVFSAIYSTCVVYSSRNSGGYLPRRFGKHLSLFTSILVK